MPLLHRNRSKVLDRTLSFYPTIVYKERKVSGAVKVCIVKFIIHISLASRESNYSFIHSQIFSYFAANTTAEVKIHCFCGLESAA